MIDADAVSKALRQVKDPEIGLNIIDLGLVYDLEIDDDPGAGTTVRVRLPTRAGGA